MNADVPDLLGNLARAVEKAREDFRRRPDPTRSAFEAAGRRLASNVLETEGDTTMEETNTGEHMLTQSERAAYQALRARGFNEVDALGAALDGVDVEEARKLSTAGEVRHIDGERFSYGEEIPLADIIARGERIELIVKQMLHRRAGLTQHDIPENSIRVRWKLEVEAVGFPRPPELQALFADVERERNHRARIRVATGLDRLEAYDVDPDPGLVRIAEEAEEAWQNGLIRAIERNEPAIRFDVPRSLVAQP